MTPTSRRPDSSPLFARPWAQTCHPGESESTTRRASPFCSRIMRANSQNTHVHVATTFPFLAFSPKGWDISQRLRSARVMRGLFWCTFGVCGPKTHNTLGRRLYCLSLNLFAALRYMYLNRVRVCKGWIYGGLLWRRTRLPVAVKCQPASAPSSEGWSFY